MIDPDGKVSFLVRFLYGRVAATALGIIDRGDDSTSFEQAWMDEKTYWDNQRELLDLEKRMDELYKELQDLNKQLGDESTCN